RLHGTAQSGHGDNDQRRARRGNPGKNQRLSDRRFGQSGVGANAVPVRYDDPESADPVATAFFNRSRDRENVGTDEGLEEIIVKLGINGWRIHGKRTGIGRYLLNILKYWTAEAIAGRFDEINFYTPQPINRDEIPLPENISVRVIGPNWRMVAWENLRMSPAAGDDVIFCPSYTIPLLRRGKRADEVIEQMARCPLLAQCSPASSLKSE